MVAGEAVGVVSSGAEGGGEGDGGRGENSGHGVAGVVIGVG